MTSIRPRATMRLQLHKGFTFADAAALAPYMAALGISHVYSSPILTARTGSMHGYDVVDPTAVNPELGGERGFRDFVAALRQAGLGLIVDIVPNHMAVGGADNPWWTDLLRHGRSSRYAAFFDVDWDNGDPSLHGKVLAPFLGRPYGEALDAGEIRLQQTKSGEPIVQYFDSMFPIDPTDYAHIAECGLESFDPTNVDGRAQLHALLERQHYRLAWWGTAGDEINWRRFFDINGLAALRIESPRVFEETHATLFRLYSDGLIDGFRVDHVDGLADPPGYCRRLRHRLHELVPSQQAYLVVEKILGAGETLPRDWDMNGTSGYDFMNEVSALQHDAASASVLGAIWHAHSGRPATFETEELAARVEVLERSFDAQLASVTTALHKMARADRNKRDITAPAIRRGLVALLSHFPVYRGYGVPEDRRFFTRALDVAKQTTPAAAHPVLDQIDAWLDGQTNPAATRFAQLSAPLTAKSVEDTAFYRYGRLLSRNDVGFDAARLGCSVADFHRACQDRLASFPDAMLATATHDHKRGEDVRARLAVISEVPEAWDAFIAGTETGETAMLYQMILGAWPLLLEPADYQDFAERLSGWQEKALREAKLRTDWTTPNQAYETQARDHLFQLFADPSFIAKAKTFVDLIAPAGAVNGLAQAVLKMTVPGMPDFFQGTEFWDFSLVDPDNRRPVDYESRRSALDKASAAELIGNWRDGRVKQAVIHATLGLRRRMPDVFARGDYTELSVQGPLRDRIVAFMRSHGDAAVIVVVPRLVQRLLRGNDSICIDPGALAGSFVSLPQSLRGRPLQPLLTHGGSLAAGSDIALDVLLADCPVTILHTSGSR